jgi:hypothetical protein
MKKDNSRYEGTELFKDKIPSEFHDEIELITDQTEKDGKEKSITFCRIEDKLFTGNYAKGQRGSTEVKPCHSKFGKKSVKIGETHTHPPDDITIGLMPSEGDLYLNMLESKQYGVKQISCITNHESKNIHCIQPKELPDPKKVNRYQKALYNTGNGNDVDPYFRENVGKDFDHSYYNRKNYKKVNPNAHDIVADNFGKSTTRLRDRDIKDWEKGTFCSLLSSYAVGRDDTGLASQVTKECKRVLKKRKISPYSWENISSKIFK